MIEWTEVDPQRFEEYPSPKPIKGPDNIDAVIALVAAGKTVEMTLADESALRGRRMAMGRRAKQQGLTLDMRYEGNKIVVRQKSDAGESAPVEVASTEHDETANTAPQSAPAPASGSRRKRS